MRDAEQLALHIALAIGHDDGKALAEFLHDCTGVDALGRENRSASGGRTGRRKQPESQRLYARAHHGGGGFGVVDESVASVSKITVAGLADEVEGRTQSADQRDRRREGRLALGLGLAL